jgi:uncharacterized membrane protein YhdT
LIMTESVLHIVIVVLGVLFHLEKRDGLIKVSEWFEGSSIFPIIIIVVARIYGGYLSVELADTSSS